MDQYNRPAQPQAARDLSRMQKETRRRRRRRMRLVRNWALFLAACAGAMALMTSGILWLLPRAHALIAGPEAFEARTYDGSAYLFDSADMRLVLVNNNLPFAQEPQPILSVADDATGQQLEMEAAEAYRRMAAAAGADGIQLVLVTGWQDALARQQAFDAQKQLYLKKSYSEEDAAARARTVVPQPDCNELATGYGAEILSADDLEKDNAFAESRAYEWLTAYAAEYGFILRWPQDRQAATGMVFEPWHWRYVGVENALAIRASGLSLEEFLALERMK
ncbi:MAG: D-alanyl-D-alanine carboxypeptidase family protein [Faecalibacterium sp.]